MESSEFLKNVIKATPMLPEHFYHIYNRANGFENLFRTDENYHFFLRRYAVFIEPVAETYAWCLMPNHFHFLIKIKSEEELLHLQGFKNPGGVEKIERFISQQFSNLFNSYTKAYNKRYQRKGSLFSPNFKRKEIRDDSYFTTLIHYIHANPVHHGFVNTIDDWAFSSYHSFLSAKRSYLKREEVLDWFGGIQEFTGFHQQPIEKKTVQEFD